MDADTVLGKFAGDLLLAAALHSQEMVVEGVISTIVGQCTFKQLKARQHSAIPHQLL